MARIAAPVRPRALVAATALALLAIPLSGCSIAIPGLSNSGSAGSGDGPNTGGTGTASSKCQVATEAIERVTSEATQSAPQLVADALAGEPINPGSLIDTVIEALDAASASITDPAVLAALGTAQTEWSGLASDVTALGAPDVSGLSEGDLSSLGQLQEYGGKLAGLYSERLPALKESGAKLQEACAAE